MNDIILFGSACAAVLSIVGVLVIFINYGREKQKMIDKMDFYENKITEHQQEIKSLKDGTLTSTNEIKEDIHSMKSILQRIEQQIGYFKEKIDNVFVIMSKHDDCIREHQVDIKLMKQNIEILKDKCE